MIHADELGSIHWVRKRDEAYEIFLDSKRRALMDKWRSRGVYYYRCVNCREDNNPEFFHIVPIFYNAYSTKSTLEPLCHKCFLYFTEDGEAEIIE